MYAHQNSLVGSIGVVSMTAHLRKLFEKKTEIKRHLITTSGHLLEKKYDPFREQPLSEEEVADVRKLQDEIFV